MHMYFLLVAGSTEKFSGAEEGIDRKDRSLIASSDSGSWKCTAMASPAEACGKNRGFGLWRTERGLVDWKPHGSVLLISSQRCAN